MSRVTSPLIRRTVSLKPIYNIWALIGVKWPPFQKRVLGRPGAYHHPLHYHPLILNVPVDVLTRKLIEGEWMDTCCHLKVTRGDVTPIIIVLLYYYIFYFDSIQIHRSSEHLRNSQYFRLRWWWLRYTCIHMSSATSVCLTLWCNQKYCLFI